MENRKKMDRSWELETADKCRLPELIPNVCDGCRDYAYCHRQLTIDDFMKTIICEEKEN